MPKMCATPLGRDAVVQMWCVFSRSLLLERACLVMSSRRQFVGLGVVVYFVFYMQISVFRVSMFVMCKIDTFTS